MSNSCEIFLKSNSFSQSWMLSRIESWLWGLFHKSELPEVQINLHLVQFELIEIVLSFSRYRNLAVYFFKIWLHVLSCVSKCSWIFGCILASLERLNAGISEHIPLLWRAKYSQKLKTTNKVIYLWTLKRRNNKEHKNVCLRGFGPKKKYIPRGYCPKAESADALHRYLLDPKT